MKSKRKHHLLIRTVIFIITLILLLCVMAIGLFYYMFSIPEPEGLSTTRFPQDFTNSFSVWTTYENGELQVEEIGLKRLDEYGLWIQFIDENGEEIFLIISLKAILQNIPPPICWHSVPVSMRMGIRYS